MTDLAAANVSYTINKKTIGESGLRNIIATLTFGNGSLTVPALGLPFLKANLGLPNELVSMKILQNGVLASAALVPMNFDVDLSNAKIRMYQSPAVSASHTHALHLNNADVADGATTTVNAGANLLGCNTGADLSVAGVANTSGAGGIVAVAATQAAGGFSAYVGAPDALSSVVVEAVGY
jgi:hypothetical protein